MLGGELGSLLITSRHLECETLCRETLVCCETHYAARRSYSVYQHRRRARERPSRCRRPAAYWRLLELRSRERGVNVIPARSGPSHSSQACLHCQKRARELDLLRTARCDPPGLGDGPHSSQICLHCQSELKSSSFELMRQETNSTAMRIETGIDDDYETLRR